MRKRCIMNAELRALLDHIKDATIKVKWDYWFFAGGRDFGNFTRYKLIHWTGSDYGTIEVNDIHGISINTLENGYLCRDYEDEDFLEEINLLLDYALRRDDKEFIAKLQHDEYGEFELPADFCDISRDDVLNGYEFG